MRRFDYLLSVLPGLDVWGSAPPVSKRDLLNCVAEAGGPIQSLHTLFLMDDLVQREALLTKELKPEEVNLAVMSLGQDGSVPALPQALLPQDGDAQDNPRLAVDEIWSRYFTYAAEVARRCGSRFLQAWVRFELGLRNALASARAQALELDPLMYIVKPELEDRDNDFSGVLAAWTTATTPLAGLEVLDKARWEWLDAHGHWYSCKADEVEAYAAKLILLHRWRRLTAA